MTRLDEIVARMAAILPDIETLGALPGDLDDTQRSDWDALNGEWDTLNAEKTVIEGRNDRLTALRSVTLDSTHTESGSEPDANRFNVNTRGSENPYDLNEITRSLQTLGDPRRSAADLRSRAITALEREGTSVMEDAHKENATRLLERSEGRSGVAKYILLTGSDEYRSAFEEYLAHPTNPQFDPEQMTALRATDALRTAMSLTSANGGYLAPFMLDPSIILTNNGATNPMRQIADVRTIDVNVWHGVSSAGVTAEWIAEATEVADASPTFSQPTITCFKADAYVQASWEVIADTGISGELSMLIADAKDRLEATAFVVGSGSGQPDGVVTAVGGVTASRVAGSSGAGGAADFVVGDVYALQNALPPRYRQNSSWLSEQTTYNKIRQFATGSGPQHAFWADLGMNIPAQLLGRPTYEASAMDNTIVSGSNDDVLLLGDFRKGYKIIDRIGMTMLYEPLVKGSSRRPTGEAAWVAYWRVGGDAVDTNAFRLLRL